MFREFNNFKWIVRESTLPHVIEISDVNVDRMLKEEIGHNFLPHEGVVMRRMKKRIFKDDFTQSVLVLME